MKKNNNTVYIYISIYLGMIVFIMLLFLLYLSDDYSTKPLTNEDLKELENYNYNYNSQVRENYISGENKEIDYCNFLSMSEDFYLEHNCFDDEIKYNQKNKLNKICMPKGLVAKVYIDNNYLDSTTKYKNCLDFKSQFITKIELVTLWNSYTLDYNEYVDFDISSEKDYNLINDWKEYKTLLKYVDEIEVNNKELSIFASKLTKYCDSGDDVCEINTIFKYVANEIKYRSDTRATENIKDPFETLEAEAGDCEDQTILLNSLFEQLGHKTFIVFTDDHAFSLVCLSNSDYEYFREEVEGRYSYFDSISDDETCFYADPTVTNGYVGYSPNDYSDLVAFDSYTKEQILLN